MDFDLFQGFIKEVSLFYYDVALCMGHPQHTHQKISLLKQFWKLTCAMHKRLEMISLIAFLDHTPVQFLFLFYMLLLEIKLYYTWNS